MSKKTAAALLIASILLLAFSTFYSLNAPGENVTETEVGHNITVSVSPSNVYVPTFLSSFLKIEITIQGTQNFTNVGISYLEENQPKLVAEYNFSARNFFIGYFTLPANASIHSFNIRVAVDNVSSLPIKIVFESNYISTIAEASLLAGISCIVVVIAGYEFKFKRIWPLIPVFIFLSAIFGQRYDDYYLISSGLRALFGTNPYLASKDVLPGLQWAYPPGFIPWSALIGWVFLHIPGSLPVTNSSLNFIGTTQGDLYGVWKSLQGSQLLLLYPMIKLPLVFSFFWVFKSLKSLTGKEQMKLWLLNPIAIVVGVMWGQLDILAVACLMQGLLYHRSGKPFLSVLFVMMGAAVKVFPVLIVPYLIYRSKNKLNALAGMLPVLIAVFVIYQLTGGFTNSVLGLLFARSVPTFQGIFVSNGLTWQVLVSALGVEHFPSLFLFAFVPLFLVLTAFSAMKEVGIETYSVLVFLLFFLTYNFVNPQYMIWIIPLLIVMRRESWAIITSLLGSVYMFLVYSYSYFLNPQLSWNYQSSYLGQLESLRVLFTGSTFVRIIIGLVATALFAYMFINSLRGMFKGDHPDEANII